MLKIIGLKYLSDILVLIIFNNQVILMIVKYGSFIYKFIDWIKIYVIILKIEINF